MSTGNYRRDVPDSTSTSLLERVRENDADAWARLTELYGALVYRWARQAGLQSTDAKDVAQDVFDRVARHIHEFRRESSTDSFRGWLWTIVRNRIRDHLRTLVRHPQATGGTDANRQLQEIPDALPDESTGKLHSQVARRALDFIRTEFDDPTWKAFWRYVIECDAPADVAEDLGIKVWSVYKAKSRVLRRLRQEFGDLID